MKYIALVLGFMAFVLAACESSSEQPDGIVVAVYSDLRVGSDLTSLTATVINGDDSRADEHTFAFSSDSIAQDSNFLVSFGVRRGKSQSLRLKLTGYRPSASGAPEPVVEQTLTADFLAGKTALLRAFLSTHCFGVLTCEADTSCHPSTGSCEPISSSEVSERAAVGDEKLTWLPAAGYSPKVPPANSLLDNLPDAGSDSGSDGEVQAQDACRSGDAMCPSECTFDNDTDCPKSAGNACGQASDCASDSCLGGYCCETECSSAHVFPSCQGGDCQSGICEEHYGDCNQNKTTDGCEALLTSDPLNCGACGRECPYGFCKDSDCVAYFEGSTNKESKLTFRAGAVYGFRFFNDESGRLASVGLRVENPNGAHLYVALFEDGVAGAANTPFPRVILSPELIIEGELVEWVVPKVERPEMFGGSKGYWFFFTLSADTSLYASAASVDVWTSTGTPEFGPIAEERPDDEYEPDPEKGVALPTLFFNVVPESLSGP